MRVSQKANAHNDELEDFQTITDDLSQSGAFFLLSLIAKKFNWASPMIFSPEDLDEWTEEWWTESDLDSFMSECTESWTWSHMSDILIDSGWNAINDMATEIKENLNLS